MREAEGLTGLADWGGLRFVDGLTAYCEAVARDAEMVEDARQEVRDMIVRLLVQRLKLYHDRATHPEIPIQQIRRPVFITGLPRSGSTLLHGMLAQDPRARSIATWEHEDISPPARAETYDSDPRIARTQARIDGVPSDLLKIHEVGARLPDECNFVTAMAFQSVNLHSRLYASSYVDWYLQADDAPAYEVHRHALQHMQAFCPRDWWVLKSPPHVFHLGRIFATYPDARVIFLHRDPAATLPSITDLFCLGKRRTYGGLDAHRAGRDTLAWWTAGMQRALAFRAGRTHEGQVFDLHYATFVANPMAAVAAIYRWLGDDPAPADAPMRRFLAEHPKNKFGAHVYTPEQYGFDAAGLRRHFADYIDAYAVPVD